MRELPKDVLANSHYSPPLQRLRTQGTREGIRSGADGNERERCSAAITESEAEATETKTDFEPTKTTRTKTMHINKLNDHLDELIAKAHDGDIATARANIIVTAAAAQIRGHCARIAYAKARNERPEIPELDRKVGK